MTFLLIYSLWGFPWKQRVYECFSGGLPRRFEVTLNYVKCAFVVPKLCLPVPELCINWSWSRDSCAGGKSPSNRRKNNDAKDSSKPGFSTILKIEIKWMIEMIWTYNKNETHDRNFTNNRNDPNDGNKTNQTNNANIFTSWTKRLCLTLKFEPKLWFKNMNVMLENHFYLDCVDFLWKIPIRLDSATPVHLDFQDFCLKILMATERMSKISNSFTPVFIVNFLYGVFILFSSESK